MSCNVLAIFEQSRNTLLKNLTVYCKQNFGRLEVNFTRFRENFIKAKRSRYLQCNS